MTGELFSLLSKHSVLQYSVSAKGWHHAAFVEAIDKAIKDPAQVAAVLFSLRANTLIGQMTGAEARSRLSGLLIGQEIAAMRNVWQGQTTAIIGADKLAKLYNIALTHLGATSACYEIKSLTLAGCTTALIKFNLETAAQIQICALEAGIQQTRSNDGRADPLGMG